MTLLQEAEQIINGPRREAYGPVEESFQRIAAAYSIVLHRKLKEPVSAHEAALMGVALKLCRESVKSSHDNLLDLAGYTGLAAMLAEWEHPRSINNPEPSTLAAIARPSNP